MAFRSVPVGEADRTVAVVPDTNINAGAIVSKTYTPAMLGSADTFTIVTDSFDSFAHLVCEVELLTPSGLTIGPFDFFLKSLVTSVVLPFKNFGGGIKVTFYNVDTQAGTFHYEIHALTGVSVADFEPADFGQLFGESGSISGGAESRDLDFAVLGQQHLEIVATATATFELAVYWWAHSNNGIGVGNPGFSIRESLGNFAANAIAHVSAPVGASMGEVAIKNTSGVSMTHKLSARLRAA